MRVKFAGGSFHDMRPPSEGVPGFSSPVSPYHPEQVNRYPFKADFDIEYWICMYNLTIRNFELYPSVCKIQMLDKFHLWYGMSIMVINMAVDLINVRQHTFCTNLRSTSRMILATMWYVNLMDFKRALHIAAWNLLPFDMAQHTDHLI